MSEVSRSNARCRSGSARRGVASWAVLVSIAPVFAQDATSPPPADSAVPPVVERALAQLDEPALRSAASARLERYGVDAVSALDRELRAWIEGRPAAPVWSVIWVTGRIGAPAARLGTRLIAVLDHATAERDGPLAIQAAWALAETTTAANGPAHQAALRRHRVAWRGTSVGGQIGIAADRVQLVIDPEMPQQYGWLQRPLIAGSLPPLAALLAWRLRRGGGGDADFDAATVAYLQDAWRTYAGSGPSRPGGWSPKVSSEVAEVAATLLATVELPAAVDGAFGLGHLARAAMTHFDPALRAAALAAFADRITGTEPDRDACIALRQGLVDDHPPVREAATRGWMQFGGAPGLIAGWLAAAEQDPAHVADAQAQARRLAARLGDGAEQLVAVATGAAPVDAVVEHWSEMQAIAADWTRLARLARWAGWCDAAWELGTREPRLVADLWPAMVDSLVFIDADGFAARCAAIGSLPVEREQIAGRLVAAVESREMGLDTAAVAAVIASIRLAETTSTETLLRVLTDGDTRARLRAVELLERRRESTPAVRLALEQAVAANHPAEIRIGRHASLDIAGRIAVQDAAERALQALTR